jgi:hypothetical protein
LLKTCREQKFCITFAMTGKCERADYTWEHKRLEGKKVAFKGVEVSMMNFLTNVTNEVRHETGAVPVVEVPVGMVMRFPFVSHCCISEFLIGEEMRDIISIEIPDVDEIDEIELNEVNRARREARREDELRELRPLELGPDIMDYSSSQHLEHWVPSPEEVEAYRQRARDFHELMELELDEIDEELEDEEGEDEIEDANGVALHVPVAQVEEIFPEANAVVLPFDVDFGARNQQVLQQLDWKAYSMTRRLQKVMFAWQRWKTVPGVFKQRQIKPRVPRIIMPLKEVKTVQVAKVV